MFGVGSVPIASYFGLPQGASADTRFSPQARGMLAQGEEYAREQAAMDAERAAEELLGEAADMTDEEIQGQLTQNPRMFGTQAIQPLSGYMQFRQSTTPQTDVTLGPILREKIQDPYHREQFEKRMLEGASANDAFDAYRTDEYNMKFETALAEAGVPETEYAKLKTPSGKFIPAAVARAQQVAKTNAEEAKRALTRRTSDDPLDKKIDAYERAMKRREDSFKATGREAELAKDQTYLGYIAKIEEAEKAKLAAVDPVADIEIDSVVPSAAAKTPAPSLPKAVEAPPTFDVTIPPEENQARMEQYKRESEDRAAKQKVADTIARAWTNKKIEVFDKLEPFYKTPDEMKAVANSLLLGKTIRVGGKAEAYIEYLAKKLGMKLDDEAFQEPESASWNRIGTQKVTNMELLIEWAKSFLEADKRAQAAAQAAAQAPQAEVPSSNVKSMKPRE
jgi:hypothetical protein